jgi:hypothetical protein
MINFYQLRAWHLDGVEDRVIARRLLDSEMSNEEILDAVVLAFEVSRDEANRLMQKGSDANLQHDLVRSLEVISDGEIEEVEGVLRLAAAEVPPDVRTAAGLTRADVEALVAGVEWKQALDALGDFEGIGWQTVRYWDLLAEAAVQIESDPAWFHWRRGEALHGIIRAELTLFASAEAVPQRGKRPVWVLGEGERRVAAMWIEQPALEPGQTAVVRLKPLMPSEWCRLSRGDEITYQQYGEDQGSAKIVETAPPRS